MTLGFLVRSRNLCRLFCVSWEIFVLHGSDWNHRVAQFCTTTEYRWLFRDSHSSLRTFVIGQPVRLLTSHTCIPIQTCTWDTRVGANNYMTDFFIFYIGTEFCPCIWWAFSYVAWTLWGYLSVSRGLRESGAGEDECPFALQASYLFPDAGSWRKLRESPFGHCPFAFHWKHSPTFLSALAFLHFRLLTNAPISNLSLRALKLRVLIVWSFFVLPSFSIVDSSALLYLDSILDCAVLILSEVDRSPATSFCTNLPGHSREVIRLFLIDFGPILYRNLERRHSVSKYGTDLIGLQLHHKLRWLENARGSCEQFVSLVRIGCISEHVALRHLLFFGSAHSREAFSKQKQSSHQAYRGRTNLFALQLIAMS